MLKDSRSAVIVQIRYKENQPPTVTDCNANDRANKRLNLQY